MDENKEINGSVVKSSVPESLPRGIRNNNPGNIRRSKANWQGKISGPDKSFETFDSHINGLRALFKLLQNYQRLYDLRTVEGIISRWAPSNENNTNAYIEAVSKDMNVPKDKEIDLKDPIYAMTLAQAIVKHENGPAPEGMPYYWYPSTDYMEAFALV